MANHQHPMRGPREHSVSDYPVRYPERKATERVDPRSMLLADVEDDSDPFGPYSSLDNPTLAAGYTYFGQLIAHDVSNLRREGEIPKNDHRATLDLQCVYGHGARFQPKDLAKFVIGGRADPKRRPTSRYSPDDVQTPDFDLPRDPNGVAQIADDRNDMHVILAQMQLAIMLTHNRIVDQLPGAKPKKMREQARRIVVHHYQWSIVHDWLPRILAPSGVAILRARLAEIRAGRLVDSWLRQDKLPAEFAFAGLRFGHSQLRRRYALNLINRSIRLLRAGSERPHEHLEGGRNMPPDWQVDWRLFFDPPRRGWNPLPPELRPQASRSINAKVSHALGRMRDEQGDRFSLPERTLEAHGALGIPSGQAICHQLGIQPLRGFGTKSTPLWYYLLREAQAQQGGQRLGELGSRIVAETFAGLLATPSSYLVREPEFRPALGGEGTCTIPDLLIAAWPDPILRARTQR